VLRFAEQRGDAELDALQADEAASGVRYGADGERGGGAVASGDAGAATGGEASGGARAGALAAMHATATVGHDKLKLQDLADFRRSQAGACDHADKVRATL
jgi:hypothetical protein